MKPTQTHFNGNRPDFIGPRLSSFEEYRKIHPVALAYKRGARIFVCEYQDAAKLLRELWRLGRAKIEIRGVISICGSLDGWNLARLNVYLQHKFARQSLNSLRAGKLHKHTWHDLQREIPLCWKT